MTDLYIDTHQGSRKAPPDVWSELREAREAQSVDGVMRRVATLRQELDVHQTDTQRLFERIRVLEAESEAVKVPSRFPLDILAASYQEWLRGQDTPKRVELSEISEAPIGPEHDAG